MPKTIASVLFACLLLAPACTTYHHQFQLGADDYVLATHDRGDGLTETYRLHVRSSTGDAMLRVETDRERVVPFLGFRLLEIDAQVGADRGVQPYSGLLVEGVYPKSAAAEAGVLAGDVLLTLDGKPMAYAVQIADFEASLVAGRVVAATVLRGQSELDLELVPTTTRRSERDTQDVPLEAAPPATRPFVGAALRGIPSVWCERIFGEPREAVVVTSVEVGSPAWLAGLRGGDLIEAVDGGPVPPVDVLVQRTRDVAAADATTTWRVRRGDDAVWEATLAPWDYSGETRFWLPLVFGLRDGVYSDRWAVGPLGLVMSNRNSYVADSRTRAVATRNVFHALLGLVRVETSPDSTEVRLLWIIRFET